MAKSTKWVDSLYRLSTTDKVIIVIMLTTKAGTAREVNPVITSLSCLETKCLDLVMDRDIRDCHQYTNQVPCLPLVF